MTDIPVIYEDDCYVAVNKPAGLVVHADGHTDMPTLAEWFALYHPPAKGVGEPIVLADGRTVARHGVAHRLDRETSGVIILAKTEESFLALKKQFQGRTVEKTYYSFLYGVPRERIGVIARPIGRSRKDFRRFSAEKDARGNMRSAVTAYTVREENGDFSFVEVRPETGRTHQIRVHMRAIGHPVVCDGLYAPRRACALGFNRLALHARLLTFNLTALSRVTLEAPFPADFLSALEILSARPS